MTTNTSPSYEGRLLITIDEAVTLTGYGKSTVEKATRRGGEWDRAGIVNRDYGVRVYLPGLVEYLAGEPGRDDVRRRLESRLAATELQARELESRLRMAEAALEQGLAIVRGLSARANQRTG